MFVIRIENEFYPIDIHYLNQREMYRPKNEENS